MAKALFPTALLLALWAGLAQPARGADFYDIADPMMGEYDGFWTAVNGAKGRVTAQIRPRANNQYDGFVLLMRARSPVTVFSLQPATAEQSKISFAKAVSAGEAATGDLLARSEAECVLNGGKLTGTFSGDLGQGTFEASKVERKSPTLGAAPPRNAVVLLREGVASGFEPHSWPLTKEGALQVGKGNIFTAQKMGSFRLHLEFRTPYMPIATGQARGNSGVYLQGKYEVQVLDSFGLYPLQDNDCSGIYRVRAPGLNACLPPMQWQTYDITFMGAQLGPSPTITVVHNGITVIDSARVARELVEKGTGGGNPAAGILMLQDHGNPVQFRNIWAEPLPPGENAPR